MGISEERASTAPGLSQIALLNLVFIIPGHTQLTLILEEATSPAVVLVNPRSAVLLTEYAPMAGNG